MKVTAGSPENPPGAIPAELSPVPHLVVVRAKKKRVSPLQRIADQLLLQWTRELEAMLAAQRREHEEVMEEMRALREERRKSTEDLCGLVQTAVMILSDIAKVISRLSVEMNQPTPHRCYGNQHLSASGGPEIPHNNQAASEGAEVLSRPLERSDINQRGAAVPLAKRQPARGSQGMALRERVHGRPKK